MATTLNERIKIAKSFIPPGWKIEKNGDGDGQWWSFIKDADKAVDVLRGKVQIERRLFENKQFREIERKIKRVINNATYPARAT